jgi:hypothetical protein
LRIRPLAYFILFALNLYLLIAQVQLYQSPVETITSPQLGYYNVPRDLFTIVIASSLLMLPYMIVHVIGAVIQAKWLYPTRLYCSITALTVLISRGIFQAVFFRGLQSPALLGIVDVSFIYLLIEGTISVLEGLKSA